MNMELRAREVELKANENGSMTVSGYVNMTEQLSEVLGSTRKFKEKIAKGAFQRAIKNAKKDIQFLAEHNNKLILASTRNSSLELREDEQGLFMSATIANTSWGRDYYELVKSGILQNFSFGFRSIKDSWRQISHDLYERTVEELELFEVSVVKDPAYSQSKIAARGIDLVEEIEVPSLEGEKLNERGNHTMMEMTETRTANEFESILKGEARSLNTTENGAELIPENTHSEIVKKMENTSAVFAKARKLNSVAGTLKIAREDDQIEAGFVGEGQDIIEGAIGFKHVKLDQKRVGAAITLTNQLINDSAVNIQEYVKDLLSRRTAKVVEKSILAGQGGDEFNGIIHDENVEAVTVEGSVTIDALADLYLSIHQEFLVDAGYIMKKSFFNSIAKLKDENGHFYVQNGVVNGKLTHTLFGLPIDITDSLTDETPVVFGNIEQAVTVMIKTQAGLQEIVDSKQALRGSKLFVFDMYMDSVVSNPQAIRKLVLA